MEIAHASIDMAKVQAFQHPIVDFPIGFRGGPVLLSPELQKFRHHRHDEPFDHVRNVLSYPHHLDGEYIYAGPIFGHFGHFMSEMIHRIVPARALKLPGKFLFVLGEDDESHMDIDRVSQRVPEVLEFLGIGRSNSVFVNRNTTVAKLHLVQQGAHLNSAPKPGYTDVLRAYSGPKLDALFGATRRPPRLYVSRSRLPRAGGILGESYLDKALIDQGFTIFHPEEHPFAVQMDHYRKADVVIFAEGSACHGTELLGSGMMKQTILIPRSFQARILRKPLEARSVAYVTADVSRYLGSLQINPNNGLPMLSRGVSVLKPRRVTKVMMEAGIPIRRSFSAWAYRACAIKDMRTYLAEMRGGNGWNAAGALRLVRSILTGGLHWTIKP
ncbi:glycosyltransferase 61 family protein [Aureimonas sp. AU12]|uniref:glycosyltransferase 61 family protein n=1 Tax=Aureimonas sp. AU12 TaxID=1638161 RepID=UPI00078566D2|nr:glycosyltransferase family 61 protein [Aureimonas sp. AU12]